MMASRPQFRPTECCLFLKRATTDRSVFYDDLQCLSNSVEEMTTVFRNLQHLTDILRSGGPSVTTTGLLAFSKMRSNFEHHLLSLKLHKPKESITQAEYVLEACRLGALIYVKCVLHNFKPICAILQSLKTQLMKVLQKAGEDPPDPADGALTWVLLIGANLSLNAQEELWFAQRIVKSIKASDPKSWDVIEKHLRRILWVDSLRPAGSISLWEKVEEMHKHDERLDPTSITNLLSSLPVMPQFHVPLTTLMAAASNPLST